MKARLNRKTTSGIIYQFPPPTQHQWSPPLCFALKTWTWTSWLHCRCNTALLPPLSAGATPSQWAGPWSVEERAEISVGSVYKPTGLHYKSQQPVLSGQFGSGLALTGCGSVLVLTNTESIIKKIHQLKSKYKTHLVIWKLKSLL